MKSEIKTPSDKRTKEYKRMVKRVKEMKVPYYNTEYGIWSYLAIRDIDNFQYNILYNTN